MLVQRLQFRLGDGDVLPGVSVCVLHIGLGVGLEGEVRGEEAARVRAGGEHWARLWGHGQQVGNAVPERV